MQHYFFPKMLHQQLPLTAYFGLEKYRTSCCKSPFRLLYVSNHKINEIFTVATEAMTFGENANLLGFFFG